MDAELTKKYLLEKEFEFSQLSFDARICDILENLSEGRWLICELLRMLRDGNIRIVVEGDFDIYGWTESANKFIAGFPRENT